MNKKDGSREVFVPQKGKLFLQFDYDAYHVRIIGKLVKQKLPDTSVHQWLADQYGCSYDESKGRTFKILYGGVTDEDRKIPFFDKVDKFINKLQLDFIKNGYLKTPKGRKIPLGWIEKPNYQKFFNYILQATETEFNIEVLNKLKKLQLPLPILYTYDSFLFEFDDSDVEEIKLVKSVLESYGFPVKWIGVKIMEKFKVYIHHYYTYELFWLYCHGLEVNPNDVPTWFKSYNRYNKNIKVKEDVTLNGTYKGKEIEVIFCNENHWDKDDGFHLFDYSVSLLQDGLVSDRGFNSNLMNLVNKKNLDFLNSKVNKLGNKIHYLYIDWEAMTHI